MITNLTHIAPPHQVPNMFPYDERAAVLEQCRNASKKEGLDLDSAVELWNYFVDKTREVRQAEQLDHCLPRPLV